MFGMFLVIVFTAKPDAVGGEAVSNIGGEAYVQGELMACIDSDGLNSEKFGYVRALEYGTNHFYDDACYNHYLIEWSCGQNEAIPIVIDCTSRGMICVEGECV
jgi:hypothetical protein